METVVDKLRLLHPTISEILAISGAPGLSLGVLHQGKIVHTAHFGNQDTSYPSPPNNETIYRIASLTKAITACAIAILVEEGKISWDTRIQDIIPEFKQRSDEVGQKATLIDVLSNRTGLPLANALWAQQNGECLVSKDEVVRTCCFLEAAKPFRKSFNYSNWNYGIATEVIERVTGASFGKFVQQRLFDPLGLKRTTFGIPTGENVAPAYAVSNAGTLCKTVFPVYSDDTGLAGGAACKSTVEDLLLLYQSMLLAYNHQVRSGLGLTPGSPFKQMATVFTPHIAVGKAAINDQAYCLGLYKTRTPGNISVASLNNLYLGPKRMPSICASSPGVEIYHHTGNLPGNTASAFLIPSLDSAVVVLTNCLPLMDPTDFVGQLIISTLLSELVSLDFISLSRVVRRTSIGSYEKLIAYLESNKTSKPPQHPLSAYEGEYFSRAGNFVLSVTPRKDGLSVKVNGSQRTAYDLHPYDGDTFYWPADHDEEVCTLSRFPDLWPDVHKFAFRTGSDGAVEYLTWGFDPGARAEVFLKRNGHRIKGSYRL